MKLNYFNQPKPDKDDKLLVKYIGDGVVPSGCLLGGPVIAQAVTKATTPCHTCKGPRERCGGLAEQAVTPPKPGLEGGSYQEVISKANDSAAARKAWRLSQRQALTRILGLKLPG